MDAVQYHAIYAFDQQLYEQIKRSKSDISELHILRQGGLHSLSTFIFGIK